MASSRWLVIGSLLLAFGFSIEVALAQSVEDVYPFSPEDGASVGPKPWFRIGVKGSDVGRMKFKIVLSKDDFRHNAYTFDWTENKDGWASTYIETGKEGAIYTTPKPIEGGDYQWKVSAWDGIQWVEGRKKRHLQIDTVAPAEVERVRARMDRKAGAIVLDWDPVTLDRNGDPERVSRYHIYRYERKSVFFVIRPFLAGTVTDTHFEDRDKAALRSEMIFYKITAEDEAGNEAERHY